MKKQLTFTHMWVDGFGWENTVLLPSDFVKVEPFGTAGGMVSVCPADFFALPLP